MEDQDLLPRHRAGLAVTREAGALALDYYRRRGSLPVERKGLQDFVSEADKKTEELIVRKLSEVFPEDSFLGEEGGFLRKGPFVWVIDPIDGTTNFLRGIHHWCVSVGLIADGRSVLGFLYDPVADEMFSASAGGGAFLNGVPVTVSGETDLSQARIGIGFSYRRPVAPHVRDIEAVLDAGCEYCRLGSGALGLAYTAAGRLDGYYERHINLWDVAGGLVIATEAGATVSDFMAADNAMTEGNELFVATPALFDPLRRLFDRS
ncbi:MAG TPA: inositol monophosphatase family protein [Bauldia sp.]|nr:inositol monophosphatase family protein [Bauldia sp.]